MIKIAIVGTCGLAQYIADFIATTTSHQFIVLSRTPNPALTQRGWQIIVIDYNNKNSLRYALAGVDTVISTISGPAQITLIDAAAASHVRRFVPSEFEGSPAARPQNDPFDAGRRQAIMRLVQHDPSGMKFTVFTCGIFYERFAPGGMGSVQIGRRSAIGAEGQYLMDVRRRTGVLLSDNAAGQPVHVCMSSARDVARFVVAALDVRPWPREFRMRGERMTAESIVAIGQHVTGSPFHTMTFSHSSLEDEVTVARALRDHDREMRAQHLMATATGRYDFHNTNLNQLVSVTPERFREWLVRVWSQPQQTA